jgi:predicted Mrr-cat superfamily restriction endonuclease
LVPWQRNRISLIDGEQLVDILIEQYDRLSTEVRERLRWALVAD